MTAWIVAGPSTHCLILDGLLPQSVGCASVLSPEVFRIELTAGLGLPAYPNSAFKVDPRADPFRAIPEDG